MTKSMTQVIKYMGSHMCGGVNYVCKPMAILHGSWSVCITSVLKMRTLDLKFLAIYTLIKTSSMAFAQGWGEPTIFFAHVQVVRVK